MSIEDLSPVTPRRNDVNEQSEVYTPERIAELLLRSATDEDSYRDAQAEVRRMGVDPSKIDHFKPARV